MVDLNGVINNFKSLGFSIDESNINRAINTNDFICDLQYPATKEELFINGISVSKYIDLWPINLQAIFEDLNNWRIRRFCPFIDLNEYHADNSDSNDFSEIIKNPSYLNLEYNTIRSSEFIKSLESMYGMDINKSGVSIDYISGDIMNHINETLKGNGFILIAHCSSLNEQLKPWVFIGLRFLLNYDSITNKVYILNVTE